jgi:Tol biopolymer transport system component
MVLTTDGYREAKVGVCFKASDHINKGDGRGMLVDKKFFGDIDTAEGFGKRMYAAVRAEGVAPDGRNCEMLADGAPWIWNLKAEHLPVSSEIRSARSVAWSPDGKEIAIEDDRGEGARTLWVVHADGSHAERIADYKGTTYDGLDWTADGKTMVISALAGDNLQLFAVPRAGGAPKQLTHDTGNLMHPRVSPDGKWIAATRIVQSKQLWRRPLN